MPNDDMKPPATRSLRDWIAGQYDHRFAPLHPHQVEMLIGRKMPALDVMAQVKFAMEVHAKLAYMFADAMIKEREATTKVDA